MGNSRKSVLFPWLPCDAETSWFFTSDWRGLALCDCCSLLWPVVCFVSITCYILLRLFAWLRPDWFNYGLLLSHGRSASSWRLLRWGHTVQSTLSSLLHCQCIMYHVDCSDVQRMLCTDKTMATSNSLCCYHRIITSTTSVNWPLFTICEYCCLLIWCSLKNEIKQNTLVIYLLWYYSFYWGSFC